MNRNIVKIFVLVGLLFSVSCLAVSGLAEDLTFAIPSTEFVAEVPGVVKVSLSVDNVGDSVMPVTMTLLDPDGNVCESFGDGGTLVLLQGQTATYEGTWLVSDEQRADGEIVYVMLMETETEDGQPVTGEKIIRIPVSGIISDLDMTTGKHSDRNCVASLLPLCVFFLVCLSFYR